MADWLGLDGWIVNFGLFRTLRMHWLCLTAGLLALVVRLPHLAWGLPDIEEEALPMKKGFEMWGWDGQGLSLDPQTAGWPSFSFYVHLALQKLHYGVGRLFGRYENRYDYWLDFQLEPTELAVLSRLLSAILGAAIVALAVELTRRSLNWRAAIFTGALLVVSPLAVQYSQMITPDILVMFFSALATWCLIQLEAQGRRRDYVLAAVFAGLGAASKYTPVLLTLPLYALHLKRMHLEGRSLRWLGWNDARLVLAASCALLAFCAASPYTFADLDVLRRDFSYQAMHLSRGHFGQEGNFGPWVYLTGVLAPALGWPALGLGVLGLIAIARRRAALLAVFLAFYLGLGFLSTHFDRYLLPALLPLACGVGFCVEAALGRMPRRWRPVAAVLAFCALIALPARGVLRYHTQLAGPSTQWLAKQYILENVPNEGTSLAIENYTVFLPFQQLEEWQQQPVFKALSESQRERFLAQKFYDYLIIPMYSSRTEYSGFYYDLRHYVATDWILTSQSVRGRYERSPELFPEQVRFYADLTRYCELAIRFEPRLGQRGPVIGMYRFRPGAIEELVRERGSLSVDSWRPYAEQLHAPHFFSFIDLLALHALKKRSLDTAQLYYSMELATCPNEEKARVTGKLAFIATLLADWENSKRLYRQVLQFDPQDHVAHGNLGLALWRSGELEAARESFRRCIALAPDEAIVAWARARLVELEKEASDSN